MNELFLSALNALNPKVVAIYVTHEGSCVSEAVYLQEFVHHETRYLGKFLGSKTDLSSLELLEENIYSILKRLVPSYPYLDVPLKLFPVKEKE